MSITGDFIRILAQAIDIAGDAFGTPKAVLVCRGLDATTAAAVVKIGNIYFGSTNAPRMQQRARDAAREAGHTFRSLQAIESQVAKLEKKAYAWRLREELAPLGPDITRINAEGARLLQELNTHHADNPDKKLTYRSIKNSTYATLTLTAESSRVKQIYDRARATDKSCPANGLIRLALAANDGTLPAAATPFSSSRWTCRLRVSPKRSAASSGFPSPTAQRFRVRRSCTQNCRISSSPPSSTRTPRRTPASTR